VNASTYQEQAGRTLLDAPGFAIPDQEIMLLWNAIGLAGEAVGSEPGTWQSMRMRSVEAWQQWQAKQQEAQP